MGVDTPEWVYIYIYICSRTIIWTVGGAKCNTWGDVMASPLAGLHSKLLSRNSFKLSVSAQHYIFYISFIYIESFTALRLNCLICKLYVYIYIYFIHIFQLFWKSKKYWGIWNQMDVSLVPNHSENGKYNLISVRFSNISKRFICV